MYIQLSTHVSTNIYTCIYNYLHIYLQISTHVSTNIYTCIYISTHLLLALGDVVAVAAVYEGAPHVLAPPGHARLPRLLLLPRLRPLLRPALGLA